MIDDERLNSNVMSFNDFPYKQIPHQRSNVMSSHYTLGMNHHSSQLNSNILNYKPIYIPNSNKHGRTNIGQTSAPSNITPSKYILLFILHNLCLT